jgi:hypothetical protein
MSISPQTIESVVVAFSAVVALFTFIFDVWNRRTDQRQSEAERWRVVLLQSLFQRKKGPMSFVDVRSEYLSLASQFQSFKLDRRELSDDSLRSTLVRMTADRILNQTGDDHYKLADTSQKIDDMTDHMGTLLGNTSDLGELFEKMSGDRASGMPTAELMGQLTALASSLVKQEQPVGIENKLPTKKEKE